MKQENKKSIEFTRRQYWDLIRATYMADWMANAICEGNMEEDDRIKEIRDYIFSFAKEMGFEDYAEYDEKLKKYYATFDLDDEPVTRKLIERYDEHVFWEGLYDRLGERDFFKKYTKDEIKKMNDEERFSKRMECEDIWGEEMEENGIERLGIIS